MTGAEIVVDAFGRIKDVVHEVVDGQHPDDLAFRADREANSIAWLVWHLTRVQDDHVATVAGAEQVWTSAGWVDRFGLPFDPAELGYGQDPAEVGKVRVSSGDLLTGYHDEVYARTVSFVASLQDADFDRIVDRSWDPPVTLGARLVSVISDDLQHAGQAAFVRGLLLRR